MDVKWNDLGSWSSMWDISDKDGEGNVAIGDVVLEKTKDCYVRSEDGLVTTLGMNQTIIVSTTDAVFVANKNELGELKSLLNRLKADKRKEVERPSETFRPWGQYFAIDSNDRYHIARIIVKAGERIIIRPNLTRSNQLIVLRGIARVENKSKILTLSESESTNLPIDIIVNVGKEPLVLVQIQTGANFLDQDFTPH